MWGKFKEPFNIVTLSVTILSIGLAIFFWLDGRKTHSISYQTINPISRIFDSKNITPSIQIYTTDSIPIMDDVWLLTGTIWNSGDFSFVKTDIISPISITIGDSLRIIDFDITRQEDADYAKFTLSQKSEHELSVGWNYFESDYGFEYQIIFIGDVTDLDINIDGKVRDVKRFKYVEHLSGPQITIIILRNFLFLIIGMAFIVFDIRYLMKGRPNINGKRLNVAEIVISVILLAVVVIGSIHLILKIFVTMNSSF